MKGQKEALRRLPQVDRLLREPSLRQAAGRLGPAPLRALLRGALARLRRAIREEGIGGEELERRLEALPRNVAQEVEGRARSTLVPVLNATGVLVHTNLGRAPLSARALDRVREAAASYTNLEYDLEARRRGSRSSHLERTLGMLLPGAACHVVNNNAAAVALVIHALAAGREVVVSRGELIEIGGSFRIPEILEASGARLREVGTTNRTRLADYERAVGKQTALILKVHPSNYRVVGFTAEAGVRELAALARRRRIPLAVDQGSGLLVPLEEYGVKGEPTVEAYLRRGADLVTFSCDKLLGGPQAGMIAGKPSLIRRLSRDPLGRAFRVDKMTIAALDATLEPFLRGKAFEEIPILRQITRPAAELQQRAEALARAVREAPGARLDVVVEPSSARVGGGAAPTSVLPSWRVGLRPAPEARARSSGVARRGDASGTGGTSVTDLERALRLGQPRVIGILGRNRLWLDLRSVAPQDDARLLEALTRARRALGGCA
ncbi:MAG: L-seryl-tRNA(Sec) selenium transferase [Acidobacteriota bacterium]